VNKSAFKNIFFSQSGFAPVVLILGVVVAIIIFLLVSSTFPFKDQLLGSLFPKDISKAAGAVDLALVPDAVTIKQGDTFLMDVTIDAKTDQPSAMELEVNFDPAILQATILEPGFFFSRSLIAPAITSGKATVTLAQDIGVIKTGTGTVATLEFKALQNTTTASAVTINSTNTQVAAIGKTGNQVGNITNSNVTVSQLAVVTKNAEFAFGVPTASQAINQEFPVQVRTKTGTDASNLFVSKISFDPTKLAVSRIDTAGSFITKWVNNNSFDNTNGKVSLIGGVPAPGFTSSSLTDMATVYFTGKAAGAAAINFDAASSIYRNSDNQNILGTLSNNTVTISSVVASPSPSPVVSPSPAVSPSVAPSASPTVAPSPSAGASPSTNPSPAVTHPPSSSPTSSPVASASPIGDGCTITQTNWVPSSNPINQGKVVSLNVKGNGLCVGRSITFTVLEDDGLLGSDPVTNQPPTVKFDGNGNATTSWLAEFHEDGFAGIGNPPEYFFNASLDGSVQVRSADPLLVVNKVTGGTPLKGDANHDGKVDFTDLSILLSNWDKTSNFDDQLDFNDDKLINTFDFSGMAQLLILANLVN
jgi:hypothetical protein